MAVPVIESYASTEFLLNVGESGEINKPSGVAAGDLLICFMVDNTNGVLARGVFENSDPNRPEGFEFIQYGRANNDCYVGLFFRVADGTEPATFTYQNDGLFSRFIVMTYRISGADPVGPIHGFRGAQPTSETNATSITTNNLTTQPEDCLLIAVGSVDADDFSSVSGTGWALENSLRASNNSVAAAVASKAQATPAAVDQCTFNWTGSDGCNAFLFAVSPAQSVAAVSPPVIESFTTALSGVGAQDLVVDIPAGTQAGDLLVAFWGNEEGSGTLRFTDEPGWTNQVSNMGGSVPDYAGRIMTRVADGTEGANVTFSLTVASLRQCAIILRISGFDPDNIIDVIGSEFNEATGGRPSVIAGVTTTKADTLVLAFGGAEGTEGTEFGGAAMFGVGWEAAASVFSSVVSSQTGLALAIAQQARGAIGTVYQANAQFRQARGGGGLSISINKAPSAASSSPGSKRSRMSLGAGLW